MIKGRGVMSQGRHNRNGESKLGYMVKRVTVYDQNEMDESKSWIQDCSNVRYICDIGKERGKICQLSVMWIVEP